MKNIFKIFLFIVLSVLLTGCLNENPVEQDNHSETNVGKTPSPDPVQWSGNSGNDSGKNNAPEGPTKEVGGTYDNECTRDRKEAWCKEYQWGSKEYNDCYERCLAGSREKTKNFKF